MNSNYFICELCGVQLLHNDGSNKTKFPVTRRFQDNDETKNLLAVRCAECDDIPYWLKEGNPSRAHLFNADGVTILKNLNREYNYWAYNIGHLLELYTSERDEESLSYIGFRFGSYSENEVAEYEEWTAKEILYRGIKLLEFMELRWSINLGDKIDKVKILNLEFVLKQENIKIDELKTGISF